MQIKKLTHTALRAMAAATLLYVSSPTKAEGYVIPNCFVITDLNGKETEFFGDVLTLFVDEESRQQMVRLAADTDDYKIDVTMPLDSVATINPTHRDRAGIVTPVIEGSGASMDFGGGVLRVTDARPGAMLQVYSLSGTRVAAHKLDSASAAFSFGSLPAGAYIVKLDGLTLKVVKK